MQYSFIDAKHAYGVNYYRVNQIDFDGKHQYTHIVASELKKKGEIKIFPNPAQSKVTLHSDLSIQEIVLYNSAMQKVGYLNPKGENSVELDLSQHKAGIYFLGIKTQNGLTYHLLIITSGFIN